MEPLVWSETVTIWVPTVPSDRVSCRKPLLRLPVTGVLAAGSLDVMRTTSELGTGFQKSSVE